MTHRTLLVLLALAGCGGGPGDLTASSTGDASTGDGTGAASFPTTTTAPTGAEDTATASPTSSASGSTTSDTSLDPSSSGTTAPATSSTGEPGSTSSTGEPGSTGDPSRGSTGAGACGDGQLDPGEECDDGDAIDDDECSNACGLPQCGDAIVQAGEGEACDDGADNGDAAACTLACEQAECGDGLVWARTEECDDGNQNDDDACGNDCVAATCSDAEQNGGETGVDCGGSCLACPILLLIGGNAMKMVGARFDGKAWTIADIAAPTVDGLDLAITSDSVGVGVFRYTKIGDPNDNRLQYVTWKAGAWSAPATIGADTTRAAPTVSAAGKGAHAVFHGDNFQFYYAGFDGEVWSPVADVVGNFGPGPGAVTTIGNGAVFVFHDGAQNNAFTSRQRSANWFPAQVIEANPQAFDHQPAIATRAGDEVVAVHALNGGGQLRWSARTGVWSAPADIAGATTTAPPALAPFGEQQVALAYRGGDGRPYVTTLQGNTWQAPAAAANPTISGPPTITRGIAGAELELVYLDGATKTLRHTRRVAGVWSAPVTISNVALERVAIASGP